MHDVAFYVATHPDDALLFRGDQLYADQHVAGGLVVHLTVSAGDAGRTDGWWEDREAGTVASLTAAEAPSGASGPVMAAVNGHTIARYSGRARVGCFLRLPGGGLDGAGFPLPLDAKSFLFRAYGWTTGAPSEDEWSMWDAKRYERLD